MIYSPIIFSGWFTAVTIEPITAKQSKLETSQNDPNTISDGPGFQPLDEQQPSTDYSSCDCLSIAAIF